jgi:hypothetical protein
VPVQSGEKITKLDDLQDIDELHVVEVILLLIQGRDRLALILYTQHAVNNMVSMLLDSCAGRSAEHPTEQRCCKPQSARWVTHSPGVSNPRHSEQSVCPGSGLTLRYNAAGYKAAAQEAASNHRSAAPEEEQHHSNAPVRLAI